MKNIFIQLIISMFFIVISHSHAIASNNQDFSSELTQQDIKKYKEMLNTPKTFNTGIRSGTVIDARSGKPIEGAVVVYIWSIDEFSIFDSGSRTAGFYEAITDDNGSYYIPDQSLKSETGALAQLGQEEAFFYKYGYIWYRVLDN